MLQSSLSTVYRSNIMQAANDFNGWLAAKSGNRIMHANDAAIQRPYNPINVLSNQARNNARVSHATDGYMSYFVNTLENLDTTVNMPLQDFTYLRDMPLRENISSAFEATSFLKNTFGINGTQSMNGGLPWSTSDGTVRAAVSADGEKVFVPLRELAIKMAYTMRQLELSANAQGQSLDTLYEEGIRAGYQFAIDKMVYLGDDFMAPNTGLLNSTQVPLITNPFPGTWFGKNPQEILACFNDILVGQNKNAALARSAMADVILLPYEAFAYVNQEVVTVTAGTGVGVVSETILEFVKKHNITTASTGRAIEIWPVKWLSNLGAGNTGRMVAYCKNERFVRFPLIPIKRTQPQFWDMTYSTIYYWLMGEVEFPYPGTIAYMDNIWGTVPVLRTAAPAVVEGIDPPVATGKTTKVAVPK